MTKYHKPTLHTSELQLPLHTHLHKLARTSKFIMAFKAPSEGTKVRILSPYFSSYPLTIPRSSPARTPLPRASLPAPSPLSLSPPSPTARAAPLPATQTHSPRISPTTSSSHHPAPLSSALPPPRPAPTPNPTPAQPRRTSPASTPSTPRDPMVPTSPRASTTREPRMASGRR